MPGIPWPPLEDALNPIAVIRTTFETIEVFPEDDDLRGDMELIIADAREGLVHALERARESTMARTDIADADLKGLRRQLLRLIEEGVERRQLDALISMGVFERVAKEERKRGSGSESERFRYRLGPEHSCGVIHVPPRELMTRFLSDLLDEVRADANYSDGLAFDRSIVQKHVALMYATLLSGDSKLFDDGD